MKWLSASLKITRVGGVEIRLHVSLLLALPAAYYFFQPRTRAEAALAGMWLAGFGLSIFLHEVGHAIVARLLGADVKQIVLWLMGGLTMFAREENQPKYTVAIASAGALMNMMLAFLFIAAYILLRLFAAPHAGTLQDALSMQLLGRASFSLALANLILTFFNLLPIYPLDGGIIFHALVEMAAGKIKADQISIWTGLPALFILMGLALYAQDYLLLLSTIVIALALSALNPKWRRALNAGIHYLFNRGGYYLLQGDYDRACEQYAADIEKNSEQPNAYLGRAACLLLLNQVERAKADAARALRLAPNHPLALEMRGEIFLLEKDLEQAETYFQRAEKVMPRWGLTYFDRGELLMERKEYAAALEQMNRGIQQMPRQAFMRLMRAQARFRLGDIAAAHADEETAVKLSDKEALVMNGVNITVYEDMLDWAEDYYAHILRRAPRQALAYWGRGDAYRVHHQYEKAIADYTRALEALPEEAQIRVERGRASFALGTLDAARQDFEVALKKTPFRHIQRQAREGLEKIRLEIESHTL